MKASTTLPFVFFSALVLCSCGTSIDSNEEIKYATVTFNANGGAFLDTEITKTLQVEIGKTFNFDEKPAKEGYKFSYWSESVTSKTVYEIGKEIVNGDLNLFAQYEAQQYFLTAQSANETFGTVSGSGLYYAGTVVSVHAFPEDGFALEGWYINEKLVSTTLDYKFEMPSEKTTIEAKFIPEGFDMLRRLGAYPYYWPETGKITYGCYPQSYVGQEMSAILSKEAKPTGDGYYSYNEQYYKLVLAKPAESLYKFDDGTSIVADSYYWFKLEAITWKILKAEEDKYFVTAEKALDICEYAEYYGTMTKKTDYQGNSAQVYANNYKYSTLRTFLNTTFLDNAFALDSSSLLTTAVDNSAKTTKDESNVYACEDTQDKLFALSYKELTDEDLNLRSAENIELKTTDYSRAIGAYSDLIAPNINNTLYYTRSPNANSNTAVDYVNFKYGQILERSVEDEYLAIRPAAWINLG